jgi:hypothetical protein
MRKCDTFYKDGQTGMVAFDCDREIEKNLKHFQIYIVNYSSLQKMYGMNREELRIQVYSSPYRKMSRSEFTHMYRVKYRPNKQQRE